MAHYAWPPEPRTAPDLLRHAAQARELARADYLARWRGVRHALGVVLAFVPIAGGAFAVSAVAGALAARAGGTTTLVLGATPGGGQSSLTLTARQAIAVAAAMVLLEACESDTFERAGTLRGMAADRRRIGVLEVSLPGLGCNNFGRRLDAAGTREVVEAALEAGVSHFDTADIYSDGASETFLGQALGARRNHVVITTKFGMGDVPEGLSGGDPRWVERACDQSLRRLGSEYIDLYLLHRPDPHVPIADTLAALNRLIDEGKVREIGCSNFSAGQLAEAHAAAFGRGLHGFACVQNEYSLLHREPEQAVLESCASLGLAFVPFFPLAMGLLSGKYRQDRPMPPEDTPYGFARSHGRSICRRAACQGAAAGPLRREARPQSARACPGLAGRQPTDRLGDRRCDDVRAGSRERRRHHGLEVRRR